MNFRVSNPQSAIRNPKSLRAFTMVEIALSLAIIGFALIAIIGVLPAGLSVQKDNREQTVINLDAAYLMDVIRSGSLGQDNLTNYIVSLTNTQVAHTNGGPGWPVTYVFTPTSSDFPGVELTNGATIVGMLSTPKYIPIANGSQPPVFVGFWSNSVTAVFRAINAPAVDQGLSQASRDFAFQYQVTVEIVPSAEYPFVAANPGWINLTAPAAIISTNPFPAAGALAQQLAQNLQANLYDIRLTFRWPVLGNGQLGGGKQVFRSSVAGAPVARQRTDSFGNRTLTFYFMQPATYTAQTP
jgi:type II secretory pathway pseudopilin PulG